MLKQFRHIKFKTQNPTITNSGSEVAALAAASLIATCGLQAVTPPSINAASSSESKNLATW